MAVEINENIEHRFEHFASFGSREARCGRIWERSSSACSITSRDVPVREAAASDVEDAEQIGMSELHCTAP